MRRMLDQGLVGKLETLRHPASAFHRAALLASTHFPVKRTSLALQHGLLLVM